MYERLYTSLVSTNKISDEKFYVKLFYRNLAESRTWKEVYASVSRNQFILEGNQVSILRSVKGNFLKYF